MVSTPEAFCSVQRKVRDIVEVRRSDVYGTVRVPISKSQIQTRAHIHNVEMRETKVYPKKKRPNHQFCDIPYCDCKEPDSFFEGPALVFEYKHTVFRNSKGKLMVKTEVLSIDEQ
jgi:hypothetical protein